jgi:hypothetical protein
MIDHMNWPYFLTDIHWHQIPEEIRSHLIDRGYPYNPRSHLPFTFVISEDPTAQFLEISRGPHVWLISQSRYHPHPPTINQIFTALIKVDRTNRLLARYGTPVWDYPPNIVLLHP